MESKDLVPSSGSPFLDQIRGEMKETYTPRFVKKKLDEFLEAEKVIYDGEGKIVSSQKDWATQMKGLEKVLELSGVSEKQLEVQKPSQVPTKITIIVNGEEKKVEVRAESKDVIETVEIKNDDNKPAA